jgi:hypothetical protein
MCKRHKKAHDKITNHVNNFSPRSMAFQGAEIFLNSEGSTLESQHSIIISKFDRGESISLQDLEKYQHLSQEDVSADHMALCTGAG